VQEYVYWIVWAFLSPLVVWAFKRWPLDAKPWYRPFGVHVLVNAVVIPVQTIAAFGLPVLVRRSGQLNVPSMVWGLTTGVFFYWLSAGVYTAFRYRERNAALEVDLTRAQLDALRSQLRPHFLFNTLNAISVLTVADADKARRMLLRLGSLLRRSLDEEQHEVSLSQELAFLNEYLDIQRVRFGDRLTVTMAIDPAASQARVPVLVLQPLVENAIKHGASDDDGTTMIIVRAERVDGRLHLTVEDRGPGPVGSAEGVGLRNTRARLRTLYGDASLRLRHADGAAGACVDINIPYSPCAS
jgi:two-component system, LytTR family, sensor kinase